MTSRAARLHALREHMLAHDLDAYLVPTSDEHLSEYVPEHRKRREYVTGFTGSAGDVLVMRDGGFLYVDGRYHLQAHEQAVGTGLTVHELGAPGVPEFLDHVEQLARERAGFRLGVDARILPDKRARDLEVRLARGSGELVIVESNLVDLLWLDAPPPSHSTLIEVPVEKAGATPEDKIASLRKELERRGARAFVTVKLDEIAWILNLRSGDDIPFNPVFEAFLIVTRDATRVFLRAPERRLAGTWGQRHPGMSIEGYEAFESAVQNIEGTVWIDGPAITHAVANALRARPDAAMHDALSPIETIKGCKNETERDAMRRANLLASAAKTRALLWLRRELRAGHTITERGFADHLEARYAELEDFHGLSFPTIAATGVHGAVIHYGDCGDTPLREGELFLIDSGVHAAFGTTDDTRTVAVGRIGARERRLVTLVLRGHVRAARQRVPDGASGIALDTLARTPLWQEGADYAHGTGHGVGTYLNVHEGPHGLATRERRSPPVPLREGMVTSIEPGYYEAGAFGVRLENLYLFLKDPAHVDERTWLVLEPLTWIPFDPRLIERDAFERDELAWLDAYHAQCRERLAPYLDASEREELDTWLAERP
ncbi:MAG: M24 family metallopeptidase [Planctomycetes bacterium]|nr:M24 family metallopeptidase [Planctomycetota bacterium]